MSMSNEGHIGAFSPSEDLYFPGNSGHPVEKSEDTFSRRRATAGSGLLLNIIERQVLPRLVVRHPSRVKSVCDSSTLEVLGSSERLADMLLTGSASQIVEIIQPFLANGVAVEKVFSQLLAPLARTVGQYWEEDRWSFVDVTMALNVLHNVLRELDAMEWSFTGGSKSLPKSIYLAPAPGDQHVFGLRMIESFFTHAGWQVTCDCSATDADITRVISKNHFNVVGFSLGQPDFLDPLRRAIDKTRRVSQNRKVEILLGGNVFQRLPSLAREFHNIVIANDGLEAISKTLSQGDGGAGNAVLP